MEFYIGMRQKMSVKQNMEIGSMVMTERKKNIRNLVDSIEIHIFIKCDQRTLYSADMSATVYLR